MVRKATREQLQSFVQSRVLLIVLIALAAFFLIGIGREVLRRYSLDQQFTDLESEIAELESQNAELTGRIAYFQSDTYREEQARLKLGFTNPGEQTVSVPLDDEATPEAEDTEAAPRPTAKNNFELWLDYFFLKKTT